MFTNEDEKLAKQIGTQCQSDNTSGECFVAAKRMAIAKNDEMRNHEQALLWCVESILDRICIDSESYNIAIDDFKNHLINNFD